MATTVNNRSAKRLPAALSAFESRTVLKPAAATSRTPPTSYVDEAQLLDSVHEEPYREALRDLLEMCRGLGLRFS